jgi:hypothetical protein
MIKTEIDYVKLKKVLLKTLAAPGAGERRGRIERLERNFAATS